MKIDILTLFPDMIESVIKESILGRAINQNLIEVNVINFRDYTENKHHKVDDYPYGGGAGMVLAPQPIFDAIDAIEMSNKTKVILTSPQGQTFNQDIATLLSKEEHLIILCGHYEGFDERIRTELVDLELSIGDYVLTGGELASLVIVDSVSRLIPNVLGKAESHQDDSFSTGLLEYPHYTRPSDFRGLTVPDVLLSGNHKRIEQWRLKESLRRTYKRRPDLLKNLTLNEQMVRMLREIRDEER
ncbi:tRNA (guanosine(37)-N1)-methyltransferase TrmD [Haloplasma contractile]|uniref:tRNA (guanine-N(1)-)-methyltransferase n=1 Tax=Haloplasma contractile SSD-17B TaxID=1033810 RepID=U2FL57_9MOLU|nr:tRNA (guanosine(37)-N1)-methyltransferase TrmD [Haloplasma contractile]ERJ13495.1 tRNA -methyltransferase protein [Haloplasma contractile SSD-17B]